jgi:NAD+ synthetase
VLAQRLAQARRPGCPLVYVNLCGGNDELIFDGRSFALDARGEPLAQLAGFAEEVRVVDLERDPPLTVVANSLEAEVFQALALGVCDFVTKNRLERVFLGLSGGVDSAVVAAIAAAALGPERVTAVAIPSRYTDPRSTACARELAGALGINFEVVALEPLQAAAEAALDELLQAGTAAENIQARLRAMVLMGFVNRYGGLLLNTSNKTELALGYTTLYGDMAGALCPLADLTKPEVVALARWLDTHRTKIPRFILDRPPSAELRPDQVDPFDYPTVAPALEHLVLANRSNVALRNSEHKRGQMGVVLKVSPKAFGSGRLMPITRR